MPKNFFINGKKEIKKLDVSNNLDIPYSYLMIFKKRYKFNFYKLFRFH